MAKYQVLSPCIKLNHVTISWEQVCYHPKKPYEPETTTKTQPTSNPAHLWMLPLPYHRKTIMIWDGCRRSANICAALFWLWRSVQIWWCSTLPVLLPPSLWHYVMNVADPCRSVLLRPTLLCLTPLHTTRSALRLSVSLLLDRCCSVPVCNTKICPDNNEGFILDENITDEPGLRRDTLTYHYNS